MDDVSPIEVASKKTDISKKIDSFSDVLERPIAKATLKSKPLKRIYQGRLLADKTKTKHFHDHTKDNSWNMKGGLTQIQQSGLQDNQAAAVPDGSFCIGKPSEGSNTSNKKIYSNTRRQYSAASKHNTSSGGQSTMSYVDALHKLTLSSSASEMPSPTTRMKTKLQMKSLHDSIAPYSSSESKTLHESMKLAEEEGLGLDSGEGNEKDMETSKYKGVASFSRGGGVGKRSKQKMRKKFLPQLPGGILAMHNSGTSELNHRNESLVVPQSQAEDDSRATLIVCREMDSARLKTDLPLVSKGSKVIKDDSSAMGTGNNTVQEEENISVKPKPVNYLGIIGNALILPMELNSETEKDSILLNTAHFNDTRVIDELIGKLSNFSIDHCLFFHSQLMMMNTFSVKQKYRHDYFSQYKKKISVLYMTLLHMAVHLDLLDSVKYLMEKYSASVDVQDCCNRTPLMLALSNPSIVRYLINAGANVNHQDRNGITPLSLLVSLANPCKESLVILIQAGADPLMVDRFEHSIMYHALVGCNREIINVLLEFCPFLPNSRIGQFTFAGKPLINQWNVVGSVSVALKYFVKLPDLLKLSVEYLNAVSFSDGPATGASLKEAYEKLKSVLKRKEELNISIDYPLPSPVYGNRREVQTVLELEEISIEGKSGSEEEFHFEMAFQCLMILERILGHGNHNSITYLNYILVKPEKHLFVKRYETKISSLSFHLLDILSQNVKTAETQSPMKDHLNCMILFMEKIAFENEAERVKYQRILLETIALFYKNQYSFHQHEYRSISTYNSINNELGYRFLCYLINNGKNQQLISAFMNNVPEFPCGQDIMESAIHAFGASQYLELCGSKFLNVPSRSKRRFILQSSSYKLPEDKSIIETLILHGAHHDSVDIKGNTLVAITRSRALMPKLSEERKQKDSSSSILNQPSPLYCIAANAVISFKFPYQTLDLPQHVITFISLHDKNIYLRLKMEEFGFVHHGFQFEEFNPA